MYQIIRITDKAGNPRTDPDSRSRLGSIGDAKMDDGCVLIHCRYDRRGDPCDSYIRTSLVKAWNKDPQTGRIIVETMNTVYYLDPVRTEPQR